MQMARHQFDDAFGEVMLSTPPLQRLITYRRHLCYSGTWEEALVGLVICATDQAVSARSTEDIGIFMIRLKSPAPGSRTHPTDRPLRRADERGVLTHPTGGLAHRMSESRISFVASAYTPPNVMGILTGYTFDKSAGID